MPHSYQINSSREVDPNTPSRQDCGLPEQSFVFCCFNNHYKIEPMIFDVWTRILKRVPDSVLWLLGGSDTIINNLRQEIGKRDVAPERLIFGEKMSVAQHLARHRQADLFLDTHFYNAHTTASDALYMGVPLITCPGESFASRVGQSLVTAAGLPELAVPDFDIYEDTAVRLANNPEELQMIKRYLIAQRTICPLFDISLFTKNLEQAYHKIWQIYQSGETARKIIVECVGITA
jgi:predicted O-linked N-acetylglucosamine transferase (SPINDLY family)